MRARTPPNHLIPPGLALTDTVLAEAAETFGTPVFVYDGGELARALARLSAALPPGTRIRYSVKANPCPAVVAKMNALRASFEISSPGELRTVLDAGADPASCLLVGPGKGRAELEEAVAAGVGLVAAESPRELEELDRLGRARRKPVSVALRLNPGAGSGAQRMSGATQFGMDPATAAEVLRKTLPGLDVAGIHGFVGTRLLDWRRLCDNFALVFGAAEEVQRATGRRFRLVEAGGGFGTPLYHGEEALDMRRLALGLETVIAAYRDRHPWTEGLSVESGRYLAASSGVMVTRVLDVKRTWGSRFVIVDGGLHALGGRDGFVGAMWGPMRLLGGRGGDEEPLTLCGPLCTPADRLAAGVRFPLPEPGDLLAVYLAGAYGPTASPGRFLSRGFPAEALYDGASLRPGNGEPLQRHLARGGCP